MPRIKRWFPVSHDINRDPEVWDLCSKFGDKALRCWLEVLSIADRNDGEVPGQLDSISTSISWAIRCRSTKTRRILDEMLTLGWIVVDGSLKVANYVKYHISREEKKLPLGSLPSEPSEPSKPNLKKEKEKPPLPPLAIPPWLEPQLWKEFKEHRQKLRKPMTRRAEELALDHLIKLRDLGNEPKAVVEQSILKGWQDFYPLNGDRPKSKSDALMEKSRAALKRGLE